MVGYLVAALWLACGVAALVLYLRNGGEPGGGPRNPMATDDGSSAGLTCLLLVASGALGLGVILLAVRDIHLADQRDATEAAERATEHRAATQAWIDQLLADRPRSPQA